MSNERVQILTVSPRFSLVVVPEWPEVDRQYTHVSVQLPGYEFTLSATDAQRLGHALNSAGGGTLPRHLRGEAS